MPLRAKTLAVTSGSRSECRSDYFPDQGGAYRYGFRVHLPADRHHGDNTNFFDDPHHLPVPGRIGSCSGRFLHVSAGEDRFFPRTDDGFDYL